MRIEGWGLLLLLAIGAIADDMSWLSASKTNKTVNIRLSRILRVSTITSLPTIAILHLNLFESLMCSWIVLSVPI